MSIHCPFSKAFEVKASYIKLFKHDCQHSAVICFVKAACDGEEKTQVRCPPQSPTIHQVAISLALRWRNVLVISQWFLHLEGRGCQAPVSLAPHIFLSQLSPPTDPLHLLIPLSFLPQASLFKFPCCQPTLAKRHTLPVSWLNCWRCLLLLGNPLRSFVPSTEMHLRNSLCKPEIPSVSFPSFSSAFSLSFHLIGGEAKQASSWSIATLSPLDNSGDKELKAC